jgi:hypothetical protein
MGNNPGIGSSGDPEGGVIDPGDEGLGADLFHITIQYIKRGKVIHLPIDSIIR